MVFVVWSLSPSQLFCDPMSCSPPSSCIRGISQARILSGFLFPPPGGSSWPRDQTHVSCIVRQILYHWATRDSPAKWRFANPQCIASLSGSFETVYLRMFCTLKCASWIYGENSYCCEICLHCLLEFTINQVATEQGPGYGGEVTVSAAWGTLCFQDVCSVERRLESWPPPIPWKAVWDGCWAEALDLSWPTSVSAQQLVAVSEMTPPSSARPAWARLWLATSVVKCHRHHVLVSLITHISEQQTVFPVT